MKMIRCILINPYSRIVSEAYITPGLEGMKYAMENCDKDFSGWVERVSVTDTEDLWLDEEGCLSPHRPVFELGSGRFAGACLILANDGEGETVSSRLPLGLIQAKVRWTNLETTGDFGEPKEYVTDHPTLGPNTAVYEGGKPIYRERA